MQTLKDIARAFMDDVHDYCNVSLYWHRQDSDRTQFNYNVRQFRRNRPWLIDNLTERETLTYRHPSNGTALFYGLRIAPDNKEQILFVANMEGAAATVVPNQLELPHLRKTGWEPALITPGLDADSIRADRDITLKDSQGVIFTRIRGE